MAYATLADLLARYGEAELIALTSADGLGVIDSAAVTQALDDAGVLIDSYLSGGGYALPLASTPAALVPIACALARYGLYPNERPQYVQDDHDQATAWLKGIASGTMRLTGVTVGTGGPSRISAPVRDMVYGADWLGQYLL